MRESVSTADIARLAEVERPAVDNWRRRHPDFPKRRRIAGQGLYLVEDVAVWLDGRKIPRNRLKNGEPVAITYGDRFRRNLGFPRPATSAQGDPYRVLWQELGSLRGATNVGAHEDLVLALLYLRACDGDRWADLVRSVGHPRLPGESGHLLERAVTAQESSIPYLRRMVPATITGAGDHQRLDRIICILDRVIQGSPPATDRPGVDAAADVFRDLLARLAAVEGKRSGEFYTPQNVVRLLVEALEPRPNSRMYDPCCGSGSLLVGAALHARSHGVSPLTPSLTGQALTERSWTLAKMNMMLHGTTGDLGPHPASALRQDLHAGQRFDVVIANPPFNMRRWSDIDPECDPRWRYGPPPENNANFAWLQHIVSSLAEGGRAAVIMANAAGSSENVRERSIRAAMVEDGTVEGLIALPPQLFFSTAIPVTIWLLRSSAPGAGRSILFIDATATGTMASRSQRVLTDDGIARIVGSYREWRNQGKTEVLPGIPGFSVSVAAQEIRKRGYLLNPRAYVTVPTMQPDASTAETVRSLRLDLERLQTRSLEVDALVDQQLKRIGIWRP